jgi:hypothetical protein
LATKRKRAKIDEVMKQLFSVSKETLVTMLGSLFGEQFKADEVDGDTRGAARKNPKGKLQNKNRVHERKERGSHSQLCSAGDEVLGV